MEHIIHHDGWENKDIKLDIHTNKYVLFNNLAVLADYGEEPYCDISVNICKLPKRQFCYDLNNNGEKLLEELIAAGLVERLELSIQSGFGTYPVCKWLGRIDK